MRIRYSISTAKMGVLGRLLSLLGTTCAVVTVGFSGLVFAVIPTNEFGGWRLTWHVLGFFGALACSVVIVWRNKAPRFVLLTIGVATLLLPLGPIGPAFGPIVGSCEIASSVAMVGAATWSGGS